MDVMKTYHKKRKPYKLNKEGRRMRHMKRRRRMTGQKQA
jgi:hypothetical protein